MIEMMTCCGDCSHYTKDHRCGCTESKEYGKRQFSNVCWKCPNFDGRLYPWDTEKAHTIGERPSTFGLVDPKDPTKFISEEHIRDASAISSCTRMEQEDGTVCYFFGNTCTRVRETMDGEKIKLEPVAGDQVACGEWTDLPVDRVHGYCTLLERHLNAGCGKGAMV